MNNSATTYIPKISRAWVNCPSSHYPAHKYNGKNVLADYNSIIVAPDRVVLAGTKLIDIYFLDGSSIVATIPLAYISPGWNKNC